MELTRESEKYIKAQQKVTEIKQFYKHLVLYILVNLFFIGRRIYKDIKYGDSVEEALFNIDNFHFFFWWGVALLIHAFNIFGKNNLFSKKWEERKVKEYMNNH